MRRRQERLTVRFDLGRALTLLGVALALGGCMEPYRYIPAPKRESVADLTDLTAPPEPPAFRYLASPAGPVRFARVAATVYRGGQPTLRDLEALRDLGVKTIVNLRREDSDAWRREELDAKRLGLRFVHFPFYGVFGANETFLLPIVKELRKGDVYVHCLHGRDRTSLMVALYRVLVENWEPQLAWKLEAIDYGSAQTYFYRQLRYAFEGLVKHFPPHPEEPPQPHPALAAEAMRAPVPAPPGATPAPAHTRPAPEGDPDVEP